MNSTKNNKYKTTNHCKYLCQYHIIWCPKYRFDILNDKIANVLKNEIFLNICKRYEYEIIEQEIMEDHIHLFVGAKPSVSPLDVVRTFKSISGIELFKKFPELKKIYWKDGSIWSRGKFISTIGFVSSETIKKYIQDQKNEC